MRIRFPAVPNTFGHDIAMEDSSHIPLSATSVVDLSVNVAEYPVDDAGKWMKNRLDGTIHPAFNTDIDGLVYNEDKKRFALLGDDAPLDLYVRRYEHRHGKRY